MNSDYQTIKEFIVSNCIHFSYDSVEGPKNLVNQAYLFDLRELTMDPELGMLAAKLVWERIKKYEPGCLFTHGIGGVPLLTNIQTVARADGYNLFILICRETRKQSNRQRLVEGPRPSPNTRAIFIDDIVNSGDTYRQSITALEEEGIQLRILGAAGILSMWAYSGTRMLEAQGKVSEFLFRRQDLGITRVFPTNELLSELLVQVVYDNSSESIDLKSPPIVEGDKVYWATDDQTVRCLDILTESVVWEYKAPLLEELPSKGITNKMAIDSTAIYFSTYSGTVYKLDKNTGQVVWGALVSRWVHSSPVLSDDGSKLFIGTENIKDTTIQYGSIVCLDTATGIEIWKTEVDSYVPCTSHIMGDRVIIGSNNNTLYCLGAASGTIWWETLLKGTVKGKANNIGDTVCVTTENGYLYLIDAKTGSILHEAISAKAFRHNFVVVYNNTFIVTDIDGLVKSYDTSGSLVWVNRVRGVLSWYPVEKDGILYITSDTGYFYTLDANTGEKLKYSYVMKDDGSGTNKTIIQCPPGIGDTFAAINTNNKGLLVYAFSN